RPPAPPVAGGPLPERAGGAPSDPSPTGSSAGKPDETGRESDRAPDTFRRATDWRTSPGGCAARFPRLPAHLRAGAAAGTGSGSWGRYRHSLVPFHLHIVWHLVLGLWHFLLAARLPSRAP